MGVGYGAGSLCSGGSTPMSPAPTSDSSRKGRGGGKRWPSREPQCRPGREDPAWATDDQPQAVLGSLPHDPRPGGPGRAVRWLRRAWQSLGHPGPDGQVPRGLLVDRSQGWLPGAVRSTSGWRGSHRGRQHRAASPDLLDHHPAVRRSASTLRSRSPLVCSPSKLPTDCRNQRRISAICRQFRRCREGFAFSALAGPPRPIGDRSWGTGTPRSAETAGRTAPARTRRRRGFEAPPGRQHVVGA